MKWTNKFNLPKPVVDAIVNDGYTKGDSDISITGLSKPPRMRVLTKIHADEITTDVSDRISSLLGRAIHKILEEANPAGLVERRAYIDIDGVTISGQADVVYSDEGILDDYKLLPVRKANENGLDADEFVAQLNSYAYLLRHGTFVEPDGTKVPTGLVINKIRIVAFFRDWFQAGVAKAAKDGFYYPPAQVQVYELPLWDDGKTLLYLKERIRLHKEANKKLPKCTPEERWAEPDKYAVMKPGARKSIKNHFDREAAECHAAQMPGAVVEFRPGSSKRCQRWCDVAQFCAQWKKESDTK